MTVRLLFLALTAFAISDALSEDSKEEVHCEIWSPANPPPDAIKQIRLGMSYLEVVELLGEPDYSPIVGQYYHSTGGNCTTDGGPDAPCGFVLEYRTIDYGSSDGISVTLPDNVEDYRLQGCSWGGIGE